MEEYGDIEDNEYEYEENGSKRRRQKRGNPITFPDLRDGKKYDILKLEINSLIQYNFYHIMVSIFMIIKCGFQIAKAHLN